MLHKPVGWQSTKWEERGLRQRRFQSVKIDQGRINKEGKGYATLHISTF